MTPTERDREPSPPTCGTCDGRGRISKVYDCGSADCDKPSGWQPCPACQPCGTCGNCNGTGKLSGGMGRGPVNCPACHGTGRAEPEETRE